MPSSILGLILFVVCLAPGAAFLAIHHRGPYAPRRNTALHETMTVVFASLIFGVASAVIIRIIAPHAGPLALEVPALVASPSAYARREPDLVGMWLLLFIALATLFAVVCAGALNNGRARVTLHGALEWCRLLPPGAARTQSAWSQLFREFEPEAHKEVTCLLDDGTKIVGWLYAFNALPDDVPDRDLVLCAPLIFYGKDGSAEIKEYGAVAVSARATKYVYVDNWPYAPSAPEEVAGPEPPMNDLAADE